MFMLQFYQELPSHLSSTVFTIGNFSLYWYSVMWIVAFAVGYTLLIYRIKKGEGSYNKEFIQNIVMYGLIGAIIGGRIGYVLFYDLQYYIAHPLEIVSPYSFSLGEWVGIYGMSYHGGLIGVIVALMWTVHKDKKDVLEVGDFVAPVVPIGYFFGRVGNFMNEELFGRVTESAFGMYFTGETALRYPSQLYEGFFEGIVLFCVLWSIRNKKYKKGTLSALYLLGYAITRFFVEYFRAPDEHLGFVFGEWSMGQILSIIMFFASGSFLLWVYKKQ
ncbi:MAG: prolipoprotein diacylglyceryl transferase [Candidatus Moraniibacteriota bacterium]|nr:MAG: prolipoprotein diacylglyceryl transferase [Candidatus Moranbacteria bacterium]